MSVDERIHEETGSTKCRSARVGVLVRAYQDEGLAILRRVLGQDALVGLWSVELGGSMDEMIQIWEFPIRGPNEGRGAPPYGNDPEWGRLRRTVRTNSSSVGPCDRSRQSRFCTPDRPKPSGDQRCDDCGDQAVHVTITARAGRGPTTDLVKGHQLIGMPGRVFDRKSRPQSLFAKSSQFVCVFGQTDVDAATAVCSVDSEFLRPKRSASLTARHDVVCPHRRKTLSTPSPPATPSSSVSGVDQVIPGCRSDMVRCPYRRRRRPVTGTQFNAVVPGIASDTVVGGNRFRCCHHRHSR